MCSKCLQHDALKYQIYYRGCNLRHGAASDGCEDMPMLLANNIMYNAFDIVHCVS